MIVKKVIIAIIYFYIIFKKQFAFADVRNEYSVQQLNYKLKAISSRDCITALMTR